MAFRDTIRKFIYGNKPRKRLLRMSKRAIIDDSPFLSALSVIAPRSAQQNWELFDFSDDNWKQLSPQKMLDILTDISPEVGLALTDFLRMVNGGWEWMVTDDNGNPNVAAEQIVNAVIDQWKRDYKSPDIVLNRMVSSMFVGGALFFEIALDETTGEYVDWKMVNPYLARFRKVKDDRRGTYFQLGMYNGGVWRPLDYDNIFYVPVDPLVDNPYGRPVISSAVFAAMFLMGVLIDVRRVIAQQGYNRIDISIDLEKLQQSMPPISDPDDFSKWVESVLEEVQEEIQKLSPEDTYIHTDVIQVNRAVGTVDASSINGVDSLIRVVERQLTRALRTMPLMLGINETVSETHAKLQWQIYAKRISAYQHLLEQTLEQAFAVILRAAGVPGNVKWRFAEVRETERIADLQAEALDIQNAWQLYSTGAITYNEYVMRLTGHEPATNEPPPPPPGTLNFGNTRAVQISPNGSNDPLPPLPSDDSDYDFEDVTTDWDKLMPDYRGLQDAEVTE